MKKYLIVEDLACNAFLSYSRNTRKHITESGKNYCYAYDKKGRLVSAAGRDPDTGKAYSLCTDGDYDDFSEDARKIFASLDR